MSDSLRNNVLFGLPYDQEKFEQALQSACLKEDLAVLAKGEFTEIGERGINLSGGQKARVSLARALYSDSDIVLLDDPLSAVDPAVGNRILK